MSLINQMLRDLDARQASRKDRAGLPPRLRPLPPSRLTRQQSMRMLLIGMALGGAVAGGIVAVVLLIFLSGPSQVPAPATQATAPMAAVAPPPPPPTASPAPASPVAQPAPVPAEAPAVLPAQPAVQAQAGVVSPVVAAPAQPAPKPISPPAATAAAIVAAAKQPAAAIAPAKTLPPTPPRVPSDSRAPPPPKQNSSPVKSGAEPASQTSPSLAERKPLTANAAAQADKAGKTDPGHDLADADYQKGMQAVNNGDQAAALPLFRNALSLNPNLAHARQALLSVLVSSRMWDEAREVARAGLAADPTRTGWAVILTRLQHERGDTDAALKTLETHLNYANDDADYLSLYAFLLHRGQRYPEAVRQYRSALALRPKEGRWWYGLGMALAATGREEEAKVAYVKAREVGNLPADMMAVIEERLK